MAEKKPSGLALLRVPFPENHISKLPKATKKQNEDLKADFKKGIRCNLCGGWHLPEVIHLDYVGHAALTDRLLDADENWTWEPVSLDLEGLPRLDRNGGLWIKLTVCGLTRLGYGNAEGKSGGDAIKEIIGDALRNAAMRFGAALDLWHKGDLHIEPQEPETKKDQTHAKDTEKKPADTPIKKKEPEAIVAPANYILPTWGGSNKGKALGGLETEVLEKLRDHMKKQLTAKPKPKHVGEIATVYAHVKAVIAERLTEPVRDDIPENNLTPNPEDETQAHPDGSEDYLIPLIDGFDAIEEYVGLPLKKISEKELRAIVKTIDAEMKITPPKVKTSTLFAVRSAIVTFFKEMDVTI